MLCFSIPLSRRRASKLTMRRRDFLKNIGLGAVAIIAGRGLLKVKSAGRPNFIYILVDNLGYGDVRLGLDELDFFKNPYIKTPNLAGLARQSVVFTHHYAARPGCPPGYGSASLSPPAKPAYPESTTGRPLAERGRRDELPGAGFLNSRREGRRNINLWIDDKSDNGKILLSGRGITIIEALKKSGYTTVVIDKWHRNYADRKKKENLSITEAAIDWLKNKRDKRRPFFLYLPYEAAGEEIVKRAEHNNMYYTSSHNKDKYCTNVTDFDAQIGRVLDTLDTLRLTGNTVVFFSGAKPAMSIPASGEPQVLDEYWGCPRSYGTACPLHGHKRQLSKEEIRVPAMIRWPGHIKPGVSDVPNSTLDIMLTICELAGVQPSKDMMPVSG